MTRAFTLCKTTTREALDNFATGVWEPRGELSQTGSVDVFHTVLKQRFRILIVDYRHVPATPERS